MDQLNFEKSRLIIEILSYIMILLFDIVLIIHLMSSGLEAISFYLEYFRMPINSYYIFIFAVMFAFIILYISLKAILIFVITLLTKLYRCPGCIIIRFLGKKEEINTKEIKFRIYLQPIPKLTFGKRLKTMKIFAKKRNYSFAFEYLYDSETLLKTLRDN